MCSSHYDSCRQGTSNPHDPQRDNLFVEQKMSENVIKYIFYQYNTLLDNLQTNIYKVIKIRFQEQRVRDREKTDQSS